MLINFENNQEIKEVWHKKEYDVFVDKIEKFDKTALDKMKEEINKRLESSEVNVTSWMPGKNWSGTPFLGTILIRCFR